MKTKEEALNYVLRCLTQIEEHFQIMSIRHESDEYGLTVSIPCEHREILDYIFTLEEEFHALGIFFSTGYGFGYRDWSLGDGFEFTPKVK